MQHNKFSLNKSKAADKLAHFLAGMLIRGMQHIAARLNVRFNRVPRKTQFRCLWAFVAFISLLIGWTSLQFTTSTAMKPTGAYQPLTIGKPSPATPTLIQDQVTDSLIKTNEHEHHH